MMYRSWFLELAATCGLDQNGLYKWTSATRHQINGISIYIKKRFDIWQEARISARYHGEVFNG